MKRESKNISVAPIEPVFFAELKSDLNDRISGKAPAITGAMSTFDQDKGLYFNGNSGLSWSFDQLAFTPEEFSIDKSFTILLDYNRDLNNYSHNCMILIGTHISNQLIDFLYQVSHNAMDLVIHNLEFPAYSSHAYTDLNTQYRNCGFTYDGTTHKASRIINGQVLEECSVTSFPTITSSHKLYVGQTSYSGDKMHGWLKNVRVYLNSFNESMLIL